MDLAMGERAEESTDLHTLLIIDDDLEWTEILKLYFDGKYNVQVANGASDAMEIIRSKKPNLIIVDLVMPSIDGFGMIHRLNDGHEVRIPTILLTGWKTPEVEECAASVGCAAVLSKPITLPELEAVVSSVVGGTRLTPAAVC